MGDERNSDGTGVRALIVLLFLYTGIRKLIGGMDIDAEFQRYGYPEWFRYVVGISETAGAAMLASRPVRVAGATVLAIIMLGALITLLNIGAPYYKFLLPATVLGLLAWLGVLESEKGKGLR